MNKPVPSSDYRSEIDGLRAVAVIPVVLFHMDYPWLPGGYLGVDVFFVISGFLITSLILKDHDRNLFTYPRFWLRRIRRIFPALVVMLILVSLAGHFVFAGTDTFALGTSGIAALLSFANIALWHLTDGYWGTTAGTLPLLHTWSLSVEEQFYFIYPVFLGLLFRFARRWIFNAVLAVAAISFALYVYGVRHHPTATFYLLPTRAWELASGCLLAIANWRYSWRPKGNSLLALIGLLAIVMSYCFLSKDHAFPGALAFVVAGSVLVIAFAADERSYGYRLLAAPPVVFVGKISYSLYLWHWPILVMANNHYRSLGKASPHLALLPLILAVSVASYYFVEKTTRHRERILLPAFVGFAASGVISGLLILNYSTLDFSDYSPVRFEGRRYDVAPVQTTWEGNERFRGVQAPMRDNAHQDAYKTAGILKGYGAGGVDVVVLGDSHGLMWAGVLDEIAAELKLNISFFTAAATNPFIGLAFDKSNENWTAEDRQIFDRTRIARIAEWKPKLVLLLTRWSSRSMEQTHALFRALQENQCRVLTIEPPPELFFGDNNTLLELSWLKMSPKEGVRQYVRSITSKERERFDSGTRLITELEQKYPFFQCIHISDLFLGDNNMVVVLDGKRVLYVDDDHLSQDGALMAKDRIKTAIESELRQHSRALQAP